jgi:DNA-binding XRE family transcriptional regulator
MSYAYHEYYVQDAMSNLGEMTEYAYHGCNSEVDKAFRYFIISGYADRFQAGDPQVVSGMSGTELYLNVLEKCGIKTPKTVTGLIRYDADAYYWAGYITAYYQWKMNLSFGTIFSVLTATDLINMYPALHTASEDRAILSIDELYHKKAMVSRLQMYRKLIGLTQSELSDASGVNLRTLQQYEIGGKDIGKASAGSVLALSKALHCRPEDIITVR